MFESTLPASSPGTVRPMLDFGPTVPGPTSPAAAHPDAIPCERATLALPQAWRLELGASLDGARLAYEIQGPEGAPVVIALGGLSAGRHVTASSVDPSPGWWAKIAGPGLAIDTRQLRLLSFDFLGGNGDSSGPRCRVPGASAGWPAITTGDQARALACLLDALGIDTVRAIVGASYGGMVGLAFAERSAENGTRVEHLVVVSAADRPHPQGVAWRTLQRRIVRLAAERGDVRPGLELARGLAMVSYRSPDELAARFDAPPQRPVDVEEIWRFPIESYLEARGADFAEHFHPDAFLRLSESIDLHRVDPSHVAVPTTLIAASSDQLVPVSQMRDLAKRLAGPCELVEIESLYGHDAFLKEHEALGGALRRVLGGAVEDAKAPAPTSAASPPGIVPELPGSTRSRTDLRPATRAVRAGLESDTQHGAVVPPIHLSSTFTFAGYGEPRRYDYTRSGNPSRDQLADALAAAEGGAGAVVTSSGLSAIHLVLQRLESGSTVVVPHDCYGGTWRLLDAAKRRGALRVRTVDPTDLDALTAALEGSRGEEAARPALLWLETPSNPLLRITDVRAACALARHAGVPVAVDNTFLSPALQRPLELGADLVVHSTTKYLNGHSDVVGGAVVAARAEDAEDLAWWANCLGLTGAPFDSYLTLRGLRTLDARLRVHQENAAALAMLLAAHPAVARVYYPGLAEHPGHAIAAAQQDGFGAMVSFELASPSGASGGETAVRLFLDGLRCFSLAESLGGVESLVAHPATMTHAAMSPEARRKAGIGDALVRLSVGIEAGEDLVDDVAAGLERVLATVPRAA